MHYKNGRIAVNGDRIVYLNDYAQAMGIVKDADPGDVPWIGRIAITAPRSIGVNLSECLHLDDVKDAISKLPQWDTPR